MLGMSKIHALMLEMSEMEYAIPSRERIEVLKNGTLNIPSNSISENAWELPCKVEKKKKKAYAMELYKHNNKQDHKYFHHKA